MIARLSGVLAEKAPPSVLVDVGGVGYEVQVPMSTFYNLPGLGEKVTLLTQFIVREDAQLLYGFLTATERESFRELIKISGVGPRIALAVLSGLNANELAQAVASQETARLIKVPGIGKKTAERMVLELREKAGAADGPASFSGSGAALPATPLAEARSALEALGYKSAEASKMTDAFPTEALSTDQIIREALKRAVR